MDLCSVTAITALLGVLCFDYGYGAAHSSLATGVCSQCNYGRGSCKRAHTSMCSKYIQCMNQEGQTIGAEMSCSWGLFWDDAIGTCNWPEIVKCPTDPCISDPGAAPYPVEGNCRGYWQCNTRGFSEAQCCAEGTRFQYLSSCVPDPDRTCSNPCPGIYESDTGLITSTVLPACPYHSADPEGKTFTGRGTLQVMTCGAGKVFNVTYCACIQVSNETEPCQPTFDLQFNGTEIADLTDKRTSYTASRVDGKGVFLGGSSITLWQFDGLPLGNPIVINFRFLDIPGGPHHQTILSNCKSQGSNEPSIAIELNRITKKLHYKAATETESIELITAYMPGTWNEIFYIHSNGSLQAVSIPIIDGVRGTVQQESQLLQGSIRTASSPLRIGSCEEWSDGFYGLIDRVTFYECDPLEDAPTDAASTTTTARSDIGIP